MNATNVTDIAIRVNTLVFLLLVGRAMRLYERGMALYFGGKSVTSMASIGKNLATALAVSVGLQFVLPQIPALMARLGVLGKVRVDIDSDKLFTETAVNPNTDVRIFRAKYKDPDSFQDYVFVFDPKEVAFDRYSVNYSRRKGRVNSLSRYDKGEVFPEDPSLRMISLPKAAGVSRRYAQPSSSKDPNFVANVIIHFFYERGGRTDAEHEAALEKFQNIGKKGRFMARRDGQYEEVPRSSRPY